MTSVTPATSVHLVSEKLTFPGHDGDELAARLDRPAGEPRAYALFAHCFTCSKDIPAAVRISRALAERGIAVLRFDFTGLGGSGGEFENTSFSSNVQDLVAAARHLERVARAPELLIGHSLGGAAVLAAARHLEAVRAVCTIAAPSSPDHVRHLLSGSVDEIEREGSAPVRLAGREFRIRREFLEDLDAQKLGEDLGALRRALLVFHSPVDRIVGIEHAERIYRAARGTKSFVSLHDADHLLTDRADADYVAAVLAAWASRYLPPAESPGDASEDPQLARGEVLVEENGPPYAQRVRAGSHELAADEPPAVGGGDLGPDPYAYLLASLGACTSMTLRMYADHKGWPLEGVRVRLVHSKVHAEDCAECESNEGKVDRIERTLDLHGAELSGEQRARLVEIADRCPVHRTLTSETVVSTRLA